MAFENNLNNKTVLEEQMRQIQEKQLKDQEDHLKRREEELKGYLSLVDDIDRDQKEREIEIINKRREFLRAIDDLKQQKDMKNRLERTTSREYENTYFPYTHGDNIERKRKNINDQLKVEMKEYFRQKKTPFIKDSLTNKSSIYTPASGSRQSEYNGQKRSFSSGHNSELESVFLKPHNQHFHRFIKEEQLEDNNKKALRRYEEQLLKEKLMRKEIENQIKESAIEAEEFKNNERIKKMRQVEATRKALDEQYKEREDKKLLEFYDNKKYTNTHFGPEEGEDLKQYYKAKRDQEKSLLDNDLKTQILNNQRIKATDKMLNSHVDKLIIEQNKNILDAEKKRAKDEKQIQQQKNMKAWNEQQAMKLRHNQVAI